jgi:hypothetical protein
MKKEYDSIVLLQSYPNLIHAVNYVLERKDESILILVNGDKKIYKFVSNIFKNHNKVTSKIYGNNIFLRRKPFSWLLPLYVVYLYIRIPTHTCKDKLITYGNWCDVGALFSFKTKSKNIINLIAFEEKRYHIKSCGPSKLPNFIKVLNYLTDNLIERKKYLYEEDGSYKFIKKDSFGMVKIDNSQTIDADREKDYTKLKHFIIEEKQPFILYIEKNILKSGSISFLNFIKLNISIYRLSKKNKIPVAIKFKPRDRYFFRSCLYKLLGFKLLSSHIPAQLYSIQESCKFIIGFSSSSMAENYGKAVYSFGSIEYLFNSSYYGNIASLRQRSTGNDLCIFLKDRAELENLQ